MMLQTMKKETNEKHFQEETYVKLLPLHDETQPTAIDGTTPGVPIDNEQLTREDLKFSVKIFLRLLEPEILTHTINTGLFQTKFFKETNFSYVLVLNELQENYLESVMISLPNYGAQLSLNDFMPLWNVIENFIDKQKILSAGVCDFMLPLLSDLCNAAKVIDFHLLKFFIFRFYLA